MRIFQASWGRSGEQQQEQNSPNLGTTFKPIPVQGTGKTSRTITTYGFFEPNGNNGEFYTETYDGALGLDGWSTPAPATNNNNPSNNNNNPGSGVIAA